VSLHGVACMRPSECQTLVSSTLEVPAWLCFWRHFVSSCFSASCCLGFRWAPLSDGPGGRPSRKGPGIHMECCW
jgi:hypothetical protein